MQQHCAFGCRHRLQMARQQQWRTCSVLSSSIMASFLTRCSLMRCSSLRTAVAQAPSVVSSLCHAACLETAEAIVRGHKSGLLTVPDYNNLTQCEALDDIKLNLVSTGSSRMQWAGVHCVQLPCTFCHKQHCKVCVLFRQAKVWLHAHSCGGQQQQRLLICSGNTV